MRRALPVAMKARDKQAVGALRSALAAIDNAEAVDVPRPTHGQGSGLAAVEQTPIAGAVVGLGAGEVERRSLTAAEMEALVRREVDDRRTAARANLDAGQPSHAERLHAEADLLSGYLRAAGPQAGPERPG